mmetsp:Transcript_5019/g.12116  ORF Transcript_5019/g.12116 Transcript_5019/m.12116 type:complete len:153 (+) Transcript_5019:201-659(+)
MEGGKGRGGQGVSLKEVDAWTRRLETDWTCTQFASGLQASPELATAILRKNGETLSSFAKARMVLALALVKRRVVSNVVPLEEALSELSSEAEDWVKVLSACLGKERIGGGPLDFEPENFPAAQTAVETLRKLGAKPPKEVFIKQQKHFTLK